MTKKKGSFLTFCFSLFPGAGQMYMGFMKRGVSLMSLFFLLILLASWLRLESLMLIMPIIWFYAFFDTHNIRAMSDEEFYALEDDYILYPEFAKEKARIFQGKYRTIFAGALIVVGISILWNNILDIFSYFIPDFLREFLRELSYYAPRLFVGTAIIALGVYLIRGKKKDLDNQEKLQMLEDRGGNQ